MERIIKWLIKPLASKFVIGETIDEAVSATKLLNKIGFSTTISLLDCTVKYLYLIDEIHKHKLDTNIAVKPSSFKDIDNLFKIVCRAKKYGIFVWLDMEGKEWTDYTLDLHRILHKKHDVGVALQTSLDRTIGDMLNLPQGSHIRLCKGAYRSPLFTNKVRKFKGCLGYSLWRDFNTYCATHDSEIIKYVKVYNSSVLWYPFKELQWLYGVKMSRARELLYDGHKVRIYLPCGKNWYSYCIRRFKENPLLVLSLLWRNRG